MFYDNIFTMEVMNEPVVASDGFTYEKKSIEQWFSKNSRSPITNMVLSNFSLIPNRSLKSQINQWQEKNTKQCIALQVVEKKNKKLKCLLIFLIAIYCLVTHVLIEL
jgi:hypothetical protein